MIASMLTIIESPLFTKLWPDYWTEEERGAFMFYLANNPDAGAVIPGPMDVAKCAGAWMAAAKAARSELSTPRNLPAEPWSHC
jgi:hypothetical protein